MTDIIPENMSENFEEDWAIFPFDQTTDGRRWVKLIEEIDDLANNREIGQSSLVEYEVRAELAQLRLVETFDDNGFSEQSPSQTIGRPGKEMPEKCKTAPKAQ